MILIRLITVLFYTAFGWVQAGIDIISAPLIGSATGLPPGLAGGNAAPGNEPPIAHMEPPTASARREPASAARPETIVEQSLGRNDAFPFQPDADGDYATVEIYYGTNRLEDPSAPISDRFLGEIGPLVYGSATVSIPRTHERGVLESQSWIMSLVAAPNPEKHVILQHLSTQETAQLLNLMNAEARFGNRAVLAYVHGFNTSFEKAARRMGQMAYDLDWQGASFFYSWPSQAVATEYLVDDTTADRSIRVMKQVLADLGSLPDADRIVLIAHSMGTRVLSEALQQLIAEGNPVADRVTAVILAAPDIDKDVFINDIAPRFNEMANASVTLYASAEDSALKLSRAARGFPRIGDTSDGLSLIDGIEVVDATLAVSNFFGHTYFGDNATIIDDMRDLVANQLLAGERPLLEQITREDGIYWRIKGAQ